MAASVLLVQSVGALPVLGAEETAPAGEAPSPAAPGSYQAYLTEHKDAAFAGQVLSISAAGYTAAEMENLTTEDNYQGKEGKTLLTGDEGYVEYTFTVNKAGFYNMRLVYFPLEGTGGSITRSFYIDGALPFEEAAGVEFSRSWADNGPITQDTTGNDIRPTQVEKPKWMEAEVRDAAGYYNDPLRFYLTEGQHTLRIVSDKEPAALHTILLHTAENLLSYEEQLAAWKAEGYTDAAQSLPLKEAENAAYKSDQMLYPINDRTSPLSTPYEVDKIRYNTIGTDRWGMAGQWLEWEINVPEDGLYTFALRFKQDAKANNVSARRLMIDGKVPFAEAEQIEFPYSGSWQSTVLGAEETGGEGYRFWLPKGDHVIRMEVTLGSFASIVGEMQDIVLDLNEIYRRIVMFTGPDPDVYRDYQFDKVIPEVIEKMADTSARLKAVEEEIKALGEGKAGQNTATIQKLYLQMDGMVKDETTISRRLNDFNNNISGLGTWLLSETSQPLQLDSFQLLKPGEAAPKAEANFFGLTKHYFLQFISSFFQDYATVGQSGANVDREITVWVGSSTVVTTAASTAGASSGNAAGRDQAQIIKQLINDVFVEKSNIGVNLQLVSAGSLLPATLAGIGPDVALQQTQADPLNYALRNAVCDLSEFAGAEEVKSRFYGSALEPFSYNGGLYALPETQTFPMLFYRKDILEELGIDEEDLRSWDSLLKKVLPLIQKSYLMFGVATTLNNYATMLYQAGGSLYSENGMTTALDSVEGIDTFERFTELYTAYKQPIAFDFANRFRTGEMPIGIADFTTYNQLSVFAPEIKGMWDMTVVPGTYRTDENGETVLDHSVAGTVTGGVIMKQSEEKEAAWEFLKWWTQADTQSRYASELESVMGSAARYPTANVEAMKTIAWDRSTQEALTEQWQYVKAIPEVPGGYFTSRYFDFAFRDVVLDGKDVRETMVSSAREINNEIRNKRQEFKLPVS